MTDKDKPLTDKIAADLEKSGFGSEMQVMSAFKKADWNTSGSATFFDLDARITRDLDVLTTKVWEGRSQGPQVRCTSTLAIEVKKVTSKHWVVLREPITDGGFLTPFRMQVAIPGFAENKAQELFGMVSELTLRSRSGWIGYGIHEFTKDSSAKSKWFGAALSIVKAADDFHRGARQVPSLLTGNDEVVFANVVQPVIVVDGMLFSATLDASGSTQVEQIESAAVEMTFRTSAYNVGPTIVDVVTLNGLPRYIAGWEKLHREFCVTVARMTDRLDLPQVEQDEEPAT